MRSFTPGPSRSQPSASRPTRLAAAITHRADAGRIDRRLDEAARQTTITVNQCALSPLKNIEASRHSPMAIPFGVAVSTVIGNNQVWFQVGVTRPYRLDPLPDVVPANERGGGASVAGAQVVGRF